MRNLTGTIPGDAYRRARVWAAQCDTSTLRVRPTSHQNTPQKLSFSSASPSLTPTPLVTYQPKTLQIQKSKFCGFLQVKLWRRT
jgi:hypothetical protein